MLMLLATAFLGGLTYGLNFAPDVYGVEYLICNITLQRLRLDANKLHEFTKIVPSGVGMIGHLQAVERFAYIKVQ